MNRAFKTFSFRAKPLLYDALSGTLGCQAIEGTDAGELLAFIKVCTIDTYAADPAFLKDPATGYAFGPVVTPGALPFLQIWAAWVANTGVRVAPIPEVTRPANDLGDISSLFPTTIGSSISLSFDKEGLMGIALESGGVVQIRRFSDTSGAIASATFDGNSPQLFFLGNLAAGLIDTACIYLREDSALALYARLQSDNFGVEYVLNDAIPIRPVELLSISAQNGVMQLLAITSEGRAATFYSPLYSASAGSEASDVSIDLDTITYYQASILADALTDSAEADISLSSITYVDAIVLPGSDSDSVLSDDAESTSISLSFIEYLAS